MLHAALKLAEAEQQEIPNALVFVGVFGLDTENGCPPVADLCWAAEALVAVDDNHGSSHDLLYNRANKGSLAHITKYIRGKLTYDEARIIDAHLARNQDRVREFVDAIPPEKTLPGKCTACQF